MIGQLLCLLGRLLVGVGSDAGFALLAVLLGDGIQLLDNHIAELLLALEQLLQLRDLALQAVHFLRPLEDIFLIDVAQLDLRDKFRLNLIDAEADH